MNKNQPSEGELFLKSFFRENGIKNQAEKVIRGLRNDDHEYRVADFYLPRLKMYVEFQGLWNNTKDDRERYKEKMRVYGKNNVPCIDIYPENLGIIEYAFHARMLKELKKHNMKIELFKYKFLRFMNQKKTTLIWFAFFMWSGIVNANYFMKTEEGSLDESIYAMIYLILIIQFILLSFNAFKYLVKER
ncbi:hypothetical protein [uncultured Draconibacterium sp.]|uniref:hypothetical protein n=1 Tax=uncultured Draconibacterium sp. TaxID=1573823 RepID=UPI002AA6A5FF|nr:hypothetical protein [uncultured Draconibacterium sp.]